MILSLWFNNNYKKKTLKVRFPCSVWTWRLASTTGTDIGWRLDVVSQCRVVPLFDAAGKPYLNTHLMLNTICPMTMPSMFLY